jgi:2-polyprenyl-3-methyl-5-hydroxy-6-metoxy-1,4-benzoquinol methylase
MTEQLQIKEPQYELLFRVKEKHGVSRLGLMVNESWNEDPRRTVFTLSRYKFVSKMLHGRTKVLEVGCADAFGTRIVQQTVGAITAVDFDPLFIADVHERTNPNWPLDARVHDMLSGPVEGGFDAAYALDVLEHMKAEDEHHFIRNVVLSVTDNAAVIMGMPSIESQAYASPQSKAGHVNCKTGPDLKETMERHFHSVFLFSMNDEVVHTGYYPMAQYLLALCAHPRR